MRKETVDVKSGGKVIGSAQVEVFETLDDAIQFFGSKETVLAMVNSSHRNSTVNNERTRLTRTQSPFTLLRAATKDDPAKMAKVNALLEELGIEL